MGGRWPHRAGRLSDVGDLVYRVVSPILVQVCRSADFCQLAGCIAVPVPPRIVAPVLVP
jgi:hypothetical protein